jgi:hypothetical protein
MRLGGIRLPSFPGVVKLSKALGVNCMTFLECEDVTDEEPDTKKPDGKQGKK